MGCAVCIEHFEEGVGLRVLPCVHPYHRSCIDQYPQWNIEFDACSRLGAAIDCLSRSNCRLEFAKDCILKCNVMRWQVMRWQVYSIFCRISLHVTGGRNG